MNNQLSAIEPKRPLIILATCCLSLFLVSMDVTIVNVALPSIRADLHASVAGLQWSIDGYTVVVASFLLLAGSTADRLGRRRTFQAGLFLFSLGSLLCSLAPTTRMLVVFRMFQALGGAMLNPVAMSIIVNTFPNLKERARAIGIWGAVLGLSMAIGPLVGGLLTQHVGWRSIFWINVPIGLIAIFLTVKFVPESRAEKPRRVDPIGQVLIIVALASLTSGVIDGRRVGWESPLILVSFALAIGSVTALIFYERQRFQPLIDVRFFQSAPFAGATVTAVMAFTAFSGFLFLNSLYLQEARGLRASEAGLCTLPIALALVICSPLSGRLVGQGNARLALVIAGCSMAVGGLLLTNLAVTTPLIQLLGAYGIFGVGLGMVNAPITNTAVSGMPRAQAGLAAAFASTSRQVGASLGVALAGTLAGGGISAAHSPEFSAATHAEWWVVFGLGLSIAALGRRFHRQAREGERSARCVSARRARRDWRQGSGELGPRSDRSRRMSAAKKGNQKVADQVWRLLSAQVMENLDAWRRQVSEVTGLPFSRVRILKRLRERPLTLRELADSAGTDAPATSLAVTDLEARGLVERGPHPEDRRAKLVSLTAAGRALVASAKKVSDSAPEKFAELGEKDLAELSRILGKLTP